MKKNTELKKFPTLRDGYGKASVIDLGSNSVKMVNYLVDSNNSYKPYHQESVRVKLAEGLIDGSIQEKYIENTIETLKLFRNIVDFERIDYETAVATSAVRDANNKEYVINKIRNETGFNFKILSESEEALYSYAGAIRSLNLPNVVFFDLGGGSLEIVFSEHFEIKKVISLPLGSLRLTRQFLSNGIIEKSFSNMKKYIDGVIPNRKSLNIKTNQGLVLVGVGGTIRSIAKYHQEKIHYPLTKLHNYSISLGSIASISREFLAQPTEKLAKIDSISSGRADTIKAGSVVISELMKKLEFSSITISAQGLREGTLSLSLQYPEDYLNHKIDKDHVQELIHLSCQPDILSEYVEDLVHLLFSVNLISDKERILLAQSIAQIDKLSSFRDVDNVLYTLLDDDSTLSHREQLIVAMSLIYSKKKKKAESLIAKFDRILKQSDKKTIKKIASVISVCDIFHKTGISLKAKSETSNSLHMDIYVPKNTFPEILFYQACKRMENSLGIIIKSSIYYKTSEYSPSKPIGII